jgi:quinol monooxygenase YgiN
MFVEVQSHPIKRGHREPFIQLRTFLLICSLMIIIQPFQGFAQQPSNATISRPNNLGAPDKIDDTAKDGRLYVFARFHAKPGSERGVEQAILKVLGPARKEPGCLGANLFYSKRDSRLFYLHSRWRDAAAFDFHGEQPYTKAFVDEVVPLIDHPLDVARTRLLD